MRLNTIVIFYKNVEFLLKEVLQLRISVRIQGGVKTVNNHGYLKFHSDTSVSDFPRPVH